ncbi:MAG UNVERIFIED_CONTAM: hypothetical protein LVR29_24265 [Microcystis novacekii LVE1205-3]|jgi:hypothetical protein
MAIIHWDKSILTFHLKEIIEDSRIRRLNGSLWFGNSCYRCGCASSLGQIRPTNSQTNYQKWPIFQARFRH